MLSQRDGRLIRYNGPRKERWSTPGSVVFARFSGLYHIQRTTQGPGIHVQSNRPQQFQRLASKPMVRASLSASGSIICSSPGPVVSIESSGPRQVQWSVPVPVVIGRPSHHQQVQWPSLVLVRPANHQQIQRKIFCENIDFMKAFFKIIIIYYPDCSFLVLLGATQPEVY